MSAVLGIACAERAARAFEREHPGVAISAPGDGGHRQWIARRDGMILASDHELGGLLSILEELLGQF